MSRIGKLLNLLSKSHHELRKRINTLELEVETLQQTIKDELYIEFMKKLDEPAKSQSLRKDNKILRKKIKALKEELNHVKGILPKSQGKKVKSKL